MATAPKPNTSIRNTILITCFGSFLSLIGAVLLFMLTRSSGKSDKAADALADLKTQQTVAQSTFTNVQQQVGEARVEVKELKGKIETATEAAIKRPELDSKLGRLEATINEKTGRAEQSINDFKQEIRTRDSLIGNLSNAAAPAAPPLGPRPTPR